MPPRRSTWKWKGKPTRTTQRKGAGTSKTPTQAVPNEARDANTKDSIDGKFNGKSTGADDIPGIKPDGATSTDSPTVPHDKLAASPESTKKRSFPDEKPSEGSPAMKKPKESPNSLEKNGSKPRFPSPPRDPATEHDKETWKGWCEIESDPAYFSSMMRDMGVDDVSVRQIFMMEPEDLDTLPQPIYGFILLMRYREVDTENQGEECPDNVWFANQLPGQNSCATLAMINILMNAEGIQLGENLQQFKNFTSDFNPQDRGRAFASFDFIKHIHNSFATKMDMLSNDKHLATKVSKNKHAKRRGSQDSNATDDSKVSLDSLEESAHHFIAFVPIDGQVWKLDGLDLQPTPIGTPNESAPSDWMTIASQRIMMLMAAAADQDYSLLALVQSPLASLRKDLCRNVKTLGLVESRLDSINSEWRSFLVTNDSASPATPTLLSSLGVADNLLATTEIAAHQRKAIESEQVPELLERRVALMSEQSSLPSNIMAEMDVESSEDQKANERKWDYGPVIKKWMEMLAENGYLQENLHRFMKK